MANIHMLFFDAGGGHRSAATALQTACARSHPDWSIELVNISKLLEPLDFFHKYAGIAGEDVYNKILEHGLTLGAEGLLRATQRIIRLNDARVRRLMNTFWGENPPDLVVSLIPNFNRPLFQALSCSSPETPYLTVMTDIADFPPNFWMEAQAQYVVCGSQRAVDQALALGYDPVQIKRVSGMILQPQLYEAQQAEIGASRTQLGLQPDVATALVLFGGHGARVMEDICDQLQSSELPVQCIFICGKNERLARALMRRKRSMPMHVEGFTREVPRFMHLSDFFIGKPGPGSISEAIHMNLPVIVQRNAWTLPQERYNTEWVEEHELGIVIRSFREVPRAVAQVLEGDRASLLRANARAVSNRAVFEVPEIMAEILHKGPACRHLAAEIHTRLHA